MKKFDRFLQNWRIRKANNFIIQGADVLDIGSHDGVMFNKLINKINSGVGIDPTLEKIIKTDKYSLYPGYFPQDLPSNLKFDAITLLAVLEHIPSSVQHEFALGCAKFLKPKGRVIITVPSPQVDYILAVLKKLGLIDGMSLEEHYGFQTKDTYNIFSAPNFKLLHMEKFQLGLNNLFVFEKADN